MSLGQSCPLLPLPIKAEGAAAEVQLVPRRAWVYDISYCGSGASGYITHLLYMINVSRSVLNFLVATPFSATDSYLLPMLATNNKFADMWPSQDMHGNHTYLRVNTLLILSSHFIICILWSTDVSVRTNHYNMLSKTTVHVVNMVNLLNVNNPLMLLNPALTIQS